MNKKIVAVTLLVLMSFAVTLSPLTFVLGQNQNLGVTIYQVTPSSLTGPVGQAVNVQGTIYSSNSSYQIIFGANVVATGTSDGYYVNANFTVPQVPSGSYSLILRDVAVNVNSTGSSPESFQVTTGYSINASPSQAQEGGSIVLNVAVTGGSPATAYHANVSVALPSPLNTIYSQIISLGASNQKGTATAQVTYPSSNFEPNGSLTDYAGSYTVYFNQSTSLAQNQFSVGFLDSTTYHRGQTVTIKATGYQANQAATLSVTNVATGSSLGSESLTASADGVISTTWVVPSNAAIGNYNAVISPQGTQKSIQDSQTFSIFGYSVQIKTLNLAGQVVPQIQVHALDSLNNIGYDNTTGSNGITTFNLETGAHSLTAYWNGVNVGVTNITVTGNGAFTLTCQLTDLKIAVQTENGIAMPFVTLVITYQYQPANGGSLKTGNFSGQTDHSGTFTLNSTLTGISYTLQASIYNQVFNSGNTVVSNLPVQALSEVVITCPNKALTLNVVGYDQAAIPGARIELVELTSGLFYSATADNSGAVNTNVTFGMYRARIYKENILINETNVGAFNDSQQQIRCTLYGIQVKVSVVDFFGSPIPNANVTLNSPAAERFSAITHSDGVASFSKIVGGDMQIVVFVSGATNDYQAITLTVSQPTSVQVKIDRYIAFGSLLIQASLLIVIVIILIGIVLFATVEIYRRKRAKHPVET